MVIILLTGGQAKAADFHVTSAQEFQTALSTAANNGEDDTVLLAAGIYPGRFSFTSAESFALAVKAEPGLNPGQVILDAEFLGRPLLLSGGSSSVNIFVENITLQDGLLNGNGAGLYINNTSGGNVSLTNNIIKGNSFGTSQYRYGAGAYIESTGTITLDQNIIKNNSGSGREAKGGGVYITGGTTVMLTGNTISNNAMNHSGSAIYFNSSTPNTLILTNNTIENNIVSVYHGTIYIQHTANEITFTENTIAKNQVNSSYGVVYIPTVNRTTTFIGNTITENSSSSHAGIYIRNSPTINFTGNTVTNNSTGTDQSYGAFYFYQYRDVVFENNIISGNTAGYMAAGYFQSYGGADSISFKGNVISDNTATNSSYAGVYMDAATTREISNNVITGNKAFSGSGGGMAVAGSGGTINFINNTIANNSATASGGGVYLSPGTSTLNAYNNIIFGNTAPTGADIYISGSGTYNGYNNAYQTMEGLWSFAGNNTNTAPIFVDGANNDFHLDSASLLINVGDNSAPAIPATDLDGNSRIADITVDLGAYEHTTEGFHPADQNQDWNVTAAEATAYGDAWRTGGTWESGPEPIPMDYTTRAGYLSTQNSGGYKNIGGGKPTNWVPGP
jgi:parallel beta-helix repeat protein